MAGRRRRVIHRRGDGVEARDFSAAPSWHGRHEHRAVPDRRAVRRARRIGDLSQRELADRAAVCPATVGRIEAGTLVPSVDVLQRLFGAAGLHLAVVDEEGHVILPMQDREDLHDGAERRYPSHLDTIVDPRLGEWWGDIYGLLRPPETFRRSRAYRDWIRGRSQWEVRVAQHRGEPPPPDPRLPLAQPPD